MKEICIRRKKLFMISSRIDYSIKRMEMDDSLSAQREQVVLRRIK